VVVPGNSFADYIFFIGGLFGHYGSSDVTVMLALVRLFRTCVEVLPASSDRLDVLDQAAAAALADAERSIPRRAISSGFGPPSPPHAARSTYGARHDVESPSSSWLARPNDPLFFQVKKA
jgi:hypothetical protein